MFSECKDAHPFLDGGLDHFAQSVSRMGAELTRVTVVRERHREKARTQMYLRKVGRERIEDGNCRSRALHCSALTSNSVETLFRAPCQLLLTEIHLSTFSNRENYYSLVIEYGEWVRHLTILSHAPSGDIQG